MKLVVIFALGSLVYLTAVDSLQAQHLDWHGDHFDWHENVPHGHDAAGHLTDRFGHHIDGHGNHTGAIGVYEDGSRSLSLSELFGNSYRSPYSGYHSGYYRSNPYYQAYANPYYSGSYYSNRGYYAAPQTLYTAPQMIAPQLAVPQIIVPRTRVLNTAPLAAVAANKVPTATQAASGIAGGTAVIRNPADSGGSLHYALNSYTYSIQPGEEQVLSIDRQWIIKFDNGLGQAVMYRLEKGTYEFTVSGDNGWDLVKRVAQSPAPPADQPAASVPRNAIPQTTK